MNDLSYRFAEEVEGGELYDLGKTKSIEKVERKGIFAPKTRTNNYFVYL